MLEKLEKHIKPYLVPLAIIFIVLGVWLRWRNIMQNDFVFYDEGYYINDDRQQFVEIVNRLYPFDLKETMQILWVDLRLSLGSGKPLWIFLINSRVIFHMTDELYFSRIISAIFGCLTIWVTYFFGRRYFNSPKIGLLSAVILAILPSHVFYSRLGMQEALSTFCFLLGFYFYVIPKKFGWRTFLSSFFFMLAYFTNYRLVVIPILVGFCEFYTFLRLQQFPDVRKYVWNTLGFVTLVFWVGSIDSGQHFAVILPWMWHQTNLAEKEAFHWYNLLSYPYFTFRLESLFFGLFFWANFYHVLKKRWYLLYPFFQVCFQMLLFSFPEEKGARYVCVVYPFMAMAAAACIAQLFEDQKNRLIGQVALALGVGLLVGSLAGKSWAIAHAKSEYREAMEYLTRIDKNIKLVSSQKWVMDLYVENPNNVQDLPHTFPQMLGMFSRGYRYLVLDPQTYISWGKNEIRFNPELDNYVAFVVNEVRPIKTFPHFNEVLLERFVLEHNENLVRSIQFLKLAKEHEFGKIRIYDMAPMIENIMKLMVIQNSQANKPQPNSPQPSSIEKPKK